MGRFYVYSHIKKTNGKCFYIGKGTDYRAWSKTGRNQHWKNIVNKHGFDVIILVNNISEEKAFELEAEFCKQIGYKNLCNLNEELGNGAWTRSEETKQKMRKSHKFSKRSSMSNETKQKIGKSNSGPNENFRKAKFKPIIQYDVSGNFIQEWNSILEAKQQYKGDIQQCCAGRSKTSCGYIWKYKTI